jgi:hypothetical protein
MSSQPEITPPRAAPSAGLLALALSSKPVFGLTLAVLLAVLRSMPVVRDHLRYAAKPRPRPAATAAMPPTPTIPPITAADGPWPCPSSLS